MGPAGVSCWRGSGRRSTPATTAASKAGFTPVCGIIANDYVDRTRVVAE
jgi:hypothetical protein